MAALAGEFNPSLGASRPACLLRATGRAILGCGKPQGLLVAVALLLIIAGTSRDGGGTLGFSFSRLELTLGRLARRLGEKCAAGGENSKTQYEQAFFHVSDEMVKNRQLVSVGSSGWIGVFFIRQENM